ncbi:S8 family serine peptidase [Anatilimnocola floriformis]|uniref:S8 family serine peptidase n=1 Tax=Anatilimnocola floriformis TaxID=2948575 RepID=UPI0020C244EE|nr:S8 family serine peptidase [Anatilimnocola floriformis]
MKRASFGNESGRRPQLNRPHPSRNRRLFLEQLEGRELMAVDSVQVLNPQPLERIFATDTPALNAGAAENFPTNPVLLGGGSQFVARPFTAPAAYQSTRLNRDLAQIGYDFDQSRLLGSAGKFTPHLSNLSVRGDQILIEANTTGSVSVLASDLKTLGSEGLTIAGSSISAWLPMNRIRDLAGLSSLAYAQAAPLAYGSHIGAANTQGDMSIYTDALRTQLGFDGTGVVVGVISDSYNRKGGAIQAPNDVTSGDLPGTTNPYGNTTPVSLLDDTYVGSDEGRAMLQIIHDIAPKATLKFHTGFPTKAKMVEAIQDLKDAGATIIVDDLIFYDEPMFQDGAIAQKVDEVVAAGVTYISAAGNAAKQSYESTGFDVSGVQRNYGRGNMDLLDFNFGLGVDAFQQITIPANQEVRITLQWQEPYKSEAPTSLGAQQDLDLLVYNAAGTIPLYSSTNNNYAGDPFEFIYIDNRGSAAFNANLVIARATTFYGAMTIKYVIDNPYVTITDYPSNAGTAFGHTNAAGAISVGASTRDSTPASTPPTLEFYSSRGYVPIYFDKFGVALPAPVYRNTPDIVAPSNVDNTFFGTDDPMDLGSKPNFTGTSAAAPHIAGLVALMKQSNPNLSPAQVLSLLEQTAKDMQSDGVYDYNTGWGLANGLEAGYAAGQPSPPDLIAAKDDGMSSTDNVTSFTNLTLTGTARAGSFVGLFNNGVLIQTQQLGAGVTSYTFNPPTTNTVDTMLYSVAIKRLSTSPAWSIRSTVCDVYVDPMASFVPTITPDLDAASDTGVYNWDNATTDTTPTFTGNVDPIAAGSKITLFIDGIPRAIQQLSPGVTAYSLTPGMPTDGYHTVTMKMQRNSSPVPTNYYSTPSMKFFTDRGAAPVATITAVTPDPRNAMVSSIAVTFSRPVAFFDLADLTLTMNGGSNRFGFGTSAATISNPSSDNRTFIVEKLNNLTMAAGNYNLSFAVSPSVVSSGGMVSVVGATETWTQGSATYQNSGRYADVNNDGYVNNTDKTIVDDMIFIYGAHTLPWTYPYTYLDVDGDGSFTSADRDAVTYFVANFSAGPY